MSLHSLSARLARLEQIASNGREQVLADVRRKHATAWLREFFALMRGNISQEDLTAWERKNPTPPELDFIHLRGIGHRINKAFE